MREFNIKDLREKSQEWGVPVETVDKDWVLGHYLNGIYQNKFLKNRLIFKGGTCLKKLYFKDYRFSEDLDFSATIELDKNVVIASLQAVQEMVYQDVGIHYATIKDNELLFNDLLMGYSFILPYWGINHPTKKLIDPNRWTTSVKIEISLREKILLPHISRSIHHPYCDNHKVVAEVKGYHLEEIFCEKLRALLQRSYSAPRDYYDLWCISTHYQDKMSLGNIPSLFQQKCLIKNIAFGGVASFFVERRLEQVKMQWKPSLGSHLRELPNIERVLDELRNALEKIFL